MLPQTSTNEAPPPRAETLPLVDMEKMERSRGSVIVNSLGFFQRRFRTDRVVCMCDTIHNAGTEVCAIPLPPPRYRFSARRPSFVAFCRLAGQAVVGDLLHEGSAS